MSNRILDNYLNFGMFTYPACYQANLKQDLPDDIRKIGYLVRKQCIHRVTLRNGNTVSNQDLRYGDMNKVPWHRQPEDDYLPTVSAMLAELYRRDARGFVADRAEENKLIVTCRFVSLLMASILKSKGIPTRVRAGFAPYFLPNPKKQSFDHWINQYWDYNKKTWITIDVDGSLEDYLNFDAYDMPYGVFDFAADAWLDVREAKVKANRFYNAGGFEGLVVIAWQLFYDFHSLMNREIIYTHTPEMVLLNNFKKLNEQNLQQIDELAKLMQNPDANFEQLTYIWQNNKDFRLLKGSLL